MTSKHCLFVASLFVFCGTSSLADFATTQAYNRLIDDILRHRFQKESARLSLDPRSIHNFTHEFKDPNGITLKASFWDGRMTGLSRVRRDGNCNVYLTPSGEEVSAHCTLLFENVTAEYTGQLKSAVHPPTTFKAKGNLPKTLAVAVIGQRLTPRMHPRVWSVSTMQAGIFTSEFTGLNSPLDQYVNMLQDRLQLIADSLFTTGIENDFRQVLQASLPNDLPPAKN